MNLITAAAEAAIRASADLLDVEACKAHVAAVEQARAAAITSAKLAAARKADSTLMSTKIALEIAVARANASTEEHVAAVAAVSAERIAKAQRVVALIDVEMIAMAAEVAQHLDAAAAIGKPLQALASRDLLNVPRNVSMPPVPAAVVAALERLPKRNPYDIPVHELRNGATSTAWAERFQELMAAEDESIFDVADDDGHKPPGGVGTPLRAAEFAS